MIYWIFFMIFFNNLMEKIYRYLYYQFISLFISRSYFDFIVKFEEDFFKILNKFISIVIISLQSSYLCELQIQGLNFLFLVSLD